MSFGGAVFHLQAEGHTGCWRPSEEEIQSPVSGENGGREQFLRILAHKKQIFTMVQTLRGQNSFDDSRYETEDRITTLPFGHYRIREIEAEKGVPG